MRKELEEALNNPLWKSHKNGDTYKMDGKDAWRMTYYPTFECGKTLEQYNEPRALIERPMIDGTDFREVPLRYLTKNYISILQEGIKKAS